MRLPRRTALNYQTSTAAPIGRAKRDTSGAAVELNFNKWHPLGVISDSIELEATRTEVELLRNMFNEILEDWK